MPVVDAAAGSAEEELFLAWFKRKKVADDENNGWVPLAKVLKAFGENTINLMRFLTGAESKYSKKVWKLGPRESMPRHNHDYKKMAGRRGGGNGDGLSWMVRKAFLKQVALTQYRSKLRR